MTAGSTMGSRTARTSELRRRPEGRVEHQTVGRSRVTCMSRAVRMGTRKSGG